MNFLQKREEYVMKWNKQIVEDGRNLLSLLGNEKYYEKMLQEGADGTDNVLTQAKNWMIRRFFNENKKRVILEVGCGLGEMCYKFENMENRVIGIDSSIHKISFCKNLERTFPNKNIEFLYMDGIKTPFLDKFFDVVFSCQVLEHFRSPSAALKEMCRIGAVVCGIVHMSESEQDNPLHTVQMNDKLIEYYLQEAFGEHYVLDFINTGEKRAFAMFVGRPSSIGYPMNMKTKLDTGLYTTFNGYLKPVGYKVVEIDKIMSLFAPSEDFSKSAINDYVSALYTHGWTAVENLLCPITLVYKVDKDQYTVFNDGNHRVAALIKHGKYKAIPAYVLTVEGY